jgi:DNA polymerase III delta subunit
MLSRMTKKTSADLLAPVTLVTGGEELLVDRAVSLVTAAVRAADPDADVRDLAPGTLQPGMLSELTSPSLFGERKAVVIRNAHDLSSDLVSELDRYLADPADTVALVLVHAGGPKGKALLDKARKAGAREVECPKVTRPGDRLGFVRAEVRNAGRSMTEDAARVLLESVGNDLRELAAACSQLAADTTGTIDEEMVGRYYTGRAEVTSFAVADRAVEGRTVEALEQLRWALAVGVAPVLVTSALAQGVRNLAKLGSAPRGLRPADLARELGMPPWKVDRVRQQLRGWTGDGIARAVHAVAEADAAIKGGGDDAAYALEKAVVAVAQARGPR